MKRVLSLVLVVVMICSTIGEFKVISIATNSIANYSKNTSEKNYIDDYANILTDSQRSLIKSDLISVSYQLSFDIAIVTTRDLNGKSKKDFADNYYDDHGYGFGRQGDGCLLLVYCNDSGSERWLSTCGYGITALTDYGIQYIGKQLVPIMDNNEWEQAFFAFIDLISHFVNHAKEQRPYDYNHECNYKVANNDSYIYANDQTINLYELFGDTFDNYIKYVNSTQYDPKLSYMLAGLARAEYSEEYLENSLQSLGFEKKDKDYKIYNTGEDFTAGHSIAKKQLKDGSTLVMITIRGSYNVTDWLNNFNATTVNIIKGYHSGFNWSKERVYDHLKAFLGDIPKSNVHYVITGHSLGAAVGNLLAVKLSDEGVPKDKVFNYNFACPDVARGNDMEWNPGGVHDNIFNLGSAKDYVSVLPGITLNGGNVLFPWGKFGRSYWFSKNWENLDEIIIDWSFDAHDAKHYVEYMERQNDLSSFKSWGEVKLARTGAYGSTILHCFFCPVDVTIYDKSGKPVAAVKDNKANYYDSKLGEVLIFVEGDKKYISLPADKEYDIRMTGTDEGEMTYTAIQQNAQTSDNITFEHIALTSGKQMQTTSGKKELTDAKLYVLDENNHEAVAEVAQNGEETPHIHEYHETIIAPGKTTLGYTLHTCDCGYSYKDNFKAPTGKVTGLKCTARTAAAMKFTWKKVADVRGYQVQLINAKGTQAGLKTLHENVYTFTKLASGHAYKARVRLYVKDADGNYYFGPWSAIIKSPTLPKGTALTGLARARKGFTAKWKKGACTGYQLQFGRKANFKGAKTVTFKSVKTVKYTAKKLAAKKYYFVRIRTYKKIAGKNYFSTWSKTYKVKTK